MVPAVAGCLQERDAKGADSDTKPGHLVPVAFRPNNSAQARSLGESIDLSPTLPSEEGGNKVCVAFGGDVARTLAARHDSSPCADRGMDVVAVPVAFQPRYFTRDNKTGGAESCGPVTAALSASHAGGDSAPCVAGTLEIRGREGGRQLEVRYDGTSNALRTPNGGRDGLGVGGVHYGMQVRRLTPTECLRLQGFPDNWLSGLELSDSAKYRMCGNAVAVPCAEWIARRLIGGAA